MLRPRPLVAGSSPRWRGGRLPACGDDVPAGVIPALAGRTGGYVCSRRTTRGHPRAGGADFPRTVWSASPQGSSPRWRGGPPSDVEGVRLAGVIPALAGRTVRADHASQSYWGHPRAGGADGRPLGTASRRPGSSPRWRGGHGMDSWCCGSGGVIPALAGRTSPPTPRLGRRTGHPRAGGADWRGLVSDAGARGSSPRWRGGRGQLDH